MVKLKLHRPPKEMTSLVKLKCPAFCNSFVVVVVVVTVLFSKSY